MAIEYIHYPRKIPYAYLQSISPPLHSRQHSSNFYHHHKLIPGLHRNGIIHTLFCFRILLLKSYGFFYDWKLAGTSLVAQWLRIRLPMQGTRVWALVREDPTCRGATKPVRHNYWACALEPASHNYRACTPRARAPQQEKPPRWEAHAPQRRVAPARCR